MSVVTNVMTIVPAHESYLQSETNLSPLVWLHTDQNPAIMDKVDEFESVALHEFEGFQKLCIEERISNYLRYTQGVSKYTFVFVFIIILPYF